MKCRVCGVEVGWEPPSGVCGVGCLRRGQGFPESGWVAVWGFRSTGKEVGILSGAPTTKAEAEAEARAFEARHEDNPACGAWVRRVEE